MWNADGSRAELSGNGARIAALWLARRSGVAFPRLRLGERLVSGRVDGEDVVATWPVDLRGCVEAATMTRRRSNVTRKPLFSMPPPSAPAVLLLTTVSLIVTSPWLSMLMPPPSSVAELAANLELETTTGPPSV